MGKAQRTRSAREKLEQVRARQRAEARRRRIAWFGGGGIAVAAVIAVIAVIAVSTGGGSSSQEVMPAGVGGTPVVQPAALTVANTTGIRGVVADYPLEVTEVDLASERGRALAAEACVQFAPGVLVDGRPFGYGRLSERRLRRALARAAAET